jgi:hypothetical protein
MGILFHYSKFLLIFIILYVLSYEVIQYYES